MKATIFAISLLLGTVAPALADATPAQPAPAVRQAGARLVPLVKDQQLVGFKVYAIQPKSRFAVANLLNGDTIEKIDGVPVTTEADAAKVTDAKAAVTVTVRRKGTTVLDLTIAAP